MKTLLAAEAGVDTTDSGDHTPLSRALELEHVARVCCLLFTYSHLHSNVARAFTRPLFFL